MRFVQWSMLAGLGVLGACSQQPIISDRCFVLVAKIQPASPSMHVGDTLTFSAVYTGPVQCLPADTTAAGVRWTSSDTAVAVDSLTGHALARSAGNAGVTLEAKGTHAVLGGTTVTVGP